METGTLQFHIESNISVRYKMKLLVVLACFLVVATSLSIDPCGPNATFIECGSGCYEPPVICGKVIGKKPPPGPRICPAVCRPRCYCNEGFWKNSKGQCVLPKDCV